MSTTTETRDYKVVGGTQPVLDWVETRLGLDPKMVSKIEITIDHTCAVTCVIHRFVTTGDLAAFPELEAADG